MNTDVKYSHVQFGLWGLEISRSRPPARIVSSVSGWRGMFKTELPFLAPLGRLGARLRVGAKKFTCRTLETRQRGRGASFSSYADRYRKKEGTVAAVGAASGTDAVPTSASRAGARRRSGRGRAWRDSRTFRFHPSQLGAERPRGMEDRGGSGRQLR